MRKILSFLALLVVGFVMPQWAHAWNFDAGEDPSKIVLHFVNGTTGDFEMKRAPQGADYSWYAEFEAKNTYVNFTVQVWNKNQDYNATLGNGAGTGELDWFAVKTDTGGQYYQSNLFTGNKYRVEIKNDGDKADSFMFRFVALERDKLYIYKTAGPTQIGSAEADADGNYTFTVKLEPNDGIVLSRNSGATTWTGVQSNQGRYNPTSDKNIPGANIDFAQSNSGAWVATREGTYTINVNWDEKKLTATCEGGNTPVVDAPASLYLYSSQPEWAARIGQAAPSAEGIYKYTVNLTANTYLVLSTKYEGVTGYDSLKGELYTPNADKPIVSGETTYFDKNEKAWYATVDGKYEITVDWGAKSFTAVMEEIIPAGVHLPLTTADFKDGKKHYFLVGERMGEWHLQPEWELKANGNQAVLSQRYIYNQNFAVAVVSSFSDYMNHRYTYYAGSGSDYWFKDDTNSADLSNKGAYSPVKGNNKNQPSNGMMQSKYDTGFGGDQDYYQGRGRYMSNIVLDLDANGNPTKLTFTSGTTEEAAKNRVFTLVGSDIYNNQFCNASSDTKTPTFNENGTTGNGWQESWIQYDPATNKPYVDARGEYLYLTSFTPDYMTANPVRFQQTLPDGSEFPYASGQIQFLEWSNLPNLDTDPYKNFYQAFSGKETISNSGAVITDNSTYNFKLRTENNSNSVTPTNNWNCYVVRDMWVGGTIKFWTGWGGNQDYTNGGSNGWVVFHGPNGGPDITEGQNKTVKGYDINSGLDAVLYKNVRNRNNTDYEISTDGTPVYFNRVVLWFNNTDGVNNSFIQFIQESAGPAILAQAATNTLNPEKENYIKYNWYLNKSQNDIDKDLQVIGYEIRRYRVIDNVTNFIGYPEGEYVDITSENVKVQDLYKETAGNYEFTKHLDTGISGKDGFAPGIYQYDIYVTYQGGARKLAWSNRVPIYDDELVTPDAVAMQLVELRDTYTDQFGTEHASGKETLGTTKKYLTYRPNDNANFYVMDAEVKEIVAGETKVNVTIPKDAELIDSKVAMKFLNEHPDKYWWTSDYYLRCLDYNEYESTLQGYIDQGLIKNTTVPSPQIRVHEIVNHTDAEGNDEDFMDFRGFAQPFDFGDQSYYSIIVKRNGNLADTRFRVYLTYPYVDADNEQREGKATAYTEVDPVTPRPFAPLYRYTYSRPDRNLDTENEWGKILVPVKNWSDGSSDDIYNPDNMKYAYVKFDKYFDPRNFTLQVDFYRPNVNLDICKFYDIQYNVKMVNKDNTVPLDLDMVLHDEDADKLITDESGNQVPVLNTLNRYRMEFKGLHPRNGVYPVVSFVKTEYVPNATADALGNKYKSQTGNFGEMLEIEAVRTVQVNTNPEGLKNVHLGKIQRENGSWDWMYKGHEDFQDDDEVLQPTLSKYEDTANDVALKPLYYLIEVKNSTDEAVYDFLVPHVPGHNQDGKDNIKVDPTTGLIMNDIDPMIGAYIAKGFKTEETPTVVATAIYMFERPIVGESPENMVNFNRLEVKEFNFNTTSVASKKAPVKRVADNITNWDLIESGKADLPDAGVLPTEKVLDMSAPNATGYNGYIAVKGATYQHTPANDNVTGVEDVLAGYEDGEVVYYNMHGIRVAEPTAAGVYLKVQGKNVSKIVVE